MSTIIGNPIMLGGGGCISAPIIGKDFNWTGDSGTYQVIDDGNKNWRIKFLSSGTFTPLKDMLIDAFLVGGGGGGGNSNPFGGAATSGGNSTAFGITADGGTGGSTVGGSGGSGGGGSTDANGSGVKGGDGGSDGSNGGNNSMSSATYIRYGGVGQGTTTREFGEETGDLYAGGGGGGCGGSGSDYAGKYGIGGEGGGGNGGHGLTSSYTWNPTAGETNTGGGGGGNSYDKGGGGGGGYTKTVKSIVLTSGTEYPIVVGAGGVGAINNVNPQIWNGCAGGSGIVIIRKHKEAAA